MTKGTIPEPPDEVKNGDGAKALWDAIWGNRLEIAKLKADIRWIGALLLLCTTVIIGGQFY